MALTAEPGAVLYVRRNGALTLGRDSRREEMDR
jgi:hypothetical protein